MNLYLNYFREELNTEGDTEPIGIVLGAYEDKLMVKYATQNISNQVFVSRYQLYLPNKEQLEQEVRRFLREEQIKVYDVDIKIQLVIFLNFLGRDIFYMVFQSGINFIQSSFDQNGKELYIG